MTSRPELVVVISGVLPSVPTMMILAKGRAGVLLKALAYWGAAVVARRARKEDILGGGWVMGFFFLSLAVGGGQLVNWCVFGEEETKRLGVGRTGQRTGRRRTLLRKTTLAVCYR